MALFSLLYPFWKLSFSLQGKPVIMSSLLITQWSVLTSYKYCVHDLKESQWYCPQFRSHYSTFKTYHPFIWRETSNIVILVNHSLKNIMLRAEGRAGNIIHCPVFIDHKDVMLPVPSPLPTPGWPSGIMTIGSIDTTMASRSTVSMSSCSSMPVAKRVKGGCFLQVFLHGVFMFVCVRGAVKCEVSAGHLPSSSYLCSSSPSTVHIFAFSISYFTLSPPSCSLYVCFHYLFFFFLFSSLSGHIPTSSFYNSRSSYCLPAGLLSSLYPVIHPSHVLPFTPFQGHLFPAGNLNPSPTWAHNQHPSSPTCFPALVVGQHAIRMPIAKRAAIEEVELGVQLIQLQGNIWAPRKPVFHFPSA